LTIAVKHRVLLTLFMLLLLAAFGLPFLSYAPNRLLSGKSLSLFSLLHGPALWLLLPLAALAILSLLPPTRGRALLAALAAKYGDDWPAIQASLEASFEEFEQRGFCLSLGDWDRNVMAAGVPLHLADGSIMVLTCGAPSFQLSEDTLKNSLAQQLDMLARDIESLGA